MKKIGILTFHRASNYGAVLQAYALQKSLIGEDVPVEIIDYRCPQVEYDHRPQFVIKKYGIIHGLRALFGVCKKKKLFDSFRSKYLHTSQKVSKSDLESIKNEYGLFVVGSDQIWSQRFSGFDDVYLLSFADSYQKYSYAGSFGFDVFPAKTKKKYIDAFNEFKMISVRESSGKELLEQEGIEARVDLDPTFLLSKEEWDVFASKPSITKPYILLYTVQPPVGLLSVARTLSQKTGYEIVYLNNSYRRNKDLKHIRFPTPEEFVGWFANAEYILTNSFHGTAFSIIFERKFKVELETKKSFNSRSRDILLELGLDDCILRNDLASMKYHESWTKQRELLDVARGKSKQYLKSLASKAIDLGAD